MTGRPVSWAIMSRPRMKSRISFACSEYDRLLLIFNDGMYKVINGHATSSLSATTWPGRQVDEND